MRATAKTTLIMLASLLALSACSASDRSSSGSATGQPQPRHGYVKGATEVQEPQLRLVSVDSAGAVAAFDPVAEQSTRLTMAGGSTRLSTDGRFAFLSAPATGAIQILDTGAWTVPHGDHSHYYLADPRVIGNVDGGARAGEGRVASSTELTAAFFPESGAVVTLDRVALGEGRIREKWRHAGVPHDGVAIPLGKRVLVSIPADAPRGDKDPARRAGSVQVYTATGEPVEEATAACADLQGTAITRVGVVFGCADGALLATETADKSIGFQRIAYPVGTRAEDVATSFAGRPGRPVVAAVSGDRGAWLLNTRALSWTFIPTTEPLLRAAAVGDAEGTIVAVDATGSVIVLSPDGIHAGSEPVLGADVVDGVLPAGVNLEVDVSRAYVNSPSAGLVYEIDYNDDARLARSFDIEGDASAFVETGR